MDRRHNSKPVEQKQAKREPSSAQPGKPKKIKKPRAEEDGKRNKTSIKRAEEVEEIEGEKYSAIVMSGDAKTKKSETGKRRRRHSSPTAPAEEKKHKAKRKPEDMTTKKQIMGQEYRKGQEINEPRVKEAKPQLVETPPTPPPTPPSEAIAMVPQKKKVRIVEPKSDGSGTSTKKSRRESGDVGVVEFGNGGESTERRRRRRRRKVGSDDNSAGGGSQGDGKRRTELRKRSAVGRESEVVVEECCAVM